MKSKIQNQANKNSINEVKIKIGTTLQTVIHSLNKYPSGFVIYGKSHPYLAQIFKFGFRSQLLYIRQIHKYQCKHCQIIFEKFCANTQQKRICQKFSKPNILLYQDSATDISIPFDLGAQSSYIIYVRMHAYIYVYIYVVVYPFVYKKIIQLVYLRLFREDSVRFIQVYRKCIFSKFSIFLTKFELGFFPIAVDQILVGKQLRWGRGCCSGIN
eukprot:TRINITY_DN6029_c0_g1_i6.p2 TRINITY_DN6029_c0_g1~~TRINITY_DN6029_c0_g1_i6.p2  ORF type:complete len:213 (-),score=-15.37 TRINITY_DN6029_c0_g1_i6:619-1257(-)